MNLSRGVGVLALGFVCSSVAPAQEKPQYLRVQCVKMAEGKAADFESIIPDNRKIAKVRVDSGRETFSVLARAVYPGGRSATCDYHFVDGFDGFPPEASQEQAQADFQKAGIAMTQPDYRAKLNAVGYLVRQEIWISRAGIGSVQKGGYVRINYNKVKQEVAADYVKWETTGWKLLAEAAVKEVPGTSWGLYTLVVPGGSEQPYNTMTVDGFPSWDAMGKGLPVRQLWTKVHPDVDFTEHMQKLSTLADRTRIEVFRVVDVIRK